MFICRFIRWGIGGEARPFPWPHYGFNPGAKKLEAGRCAKRNFLFSFKEKIKISEAAAGCRCFAVASNAQAFNLSDIK